MDGELVSHGCDAHSANGAQAVGVLVISPEKRAALVEAACSMINAADDRERPHLAAQLDSVVATYLFHKAEQPIALSPKAIREKLRKLNGSVNKVIDEILDMPSDVAIALEPLAPPPLHSDDKGLSLVDQVVEILVLLQQAIAIFDTEYSPPTGRGSDIALQSALALAAQIIKSATGEDLRARYNKPDNAPPVFITPAGRAIRDLLIGVDPSLNDTKIANMLERLRKVRPSPSRAEAIAAPGLAADLDASLLPNRKLE